MGKRKPILCLDFDGVIHSYDSGWKGADMIPDPPVPGAFDFIRNSLEIFEVHVYSSRSHQKGGIEAMANWFHRHGWVANISMRGEKSATPDHLHLPDCKPPAVVSLDDRGVRFEGTFPNPHDLIRLKPWNK